MGLTNLNKGLCFPAKEAPTVLWPENSIDDGVLMMVAAHNFEIVMLTNSIRKWMSIKLIYRICKTRTH